MIKSLLLLILLLTIVSSQCMCPCTCTSTPTSKPTKSPTFPTKNPTKRPTKRPTYSPTLFPTTYSPSTSPTQSPTTYSPSTSPTLSPSTSPNIVTHSPTLSPTTSPTTSPTLSPNVITYSPTLSPTLITYSPSTSPSVSPTVPPTTINPTLRPTEAPTAYVYPGWAKGYYANKTYYTGVPQATVNVNNYTFLLKTPLISDLQMKELSRLCVERINLYRNGTLKFSNGNSDPLLGTAVPLQYIPQMDKCHAEISLGDFSLMGPGCGYGAHVNYRMCKGFVESRQSGQNMCCPWPVGNFDKTLDSLYNCLQIMWNEGMPGATQTGHWTAMKNPNFKVASCGFAFANNGKTALMTQNFGGNYIPSAIDEPYAVEY